jgi:hypothetical protein
MYLPHNTDQKWQNFAASLADQRDSQNIPGLVHLLNHDLAEIDTNAPNSLAAEITTNGS